MSCRSCGLVLVTVTSWGPLSLSFSETIFLLGRPTSVFIFSPSTALPAPTLLLAHQSFARPRAEITPSLLATVAAAAVAVVHQRQPHLLQHVHSYEEGGTREIRPRSAQQRRFGSGCLEGPVRGGIGAGRSARNQNFSLSECLASHAPQGGKQAEDRTVELELGGGRWSTYTSLSFT